MSVTSSRPLALAVDVVVGDRDSVIRVGAKDDVLSADVGGRDMIDPNKISAIKGNSVSAPNILRVQFSNMDVLNNNILGSLDIKTLALDDTIRTNTNDRLIRVDDNRVQARLIVANIDLGGIRLIVVTPIILVDSRLAARARTPGRTALLGRSALGTGKVELLVEQDDARGRVAKHRDQLIG